MSVSVRLALTGDVMLGRGIDQIMPRSCPPEIYEPYVRDARDYVALAERMNGRIPATVAPAYVWGDAEPALDRAAPDLRLINLETAVTCHGAPWSGKDIHYRMHPANIVCLQALDVDGCALANNHVLDWSEGGLHDTLDTLQRVGIAQAGAGENVDVARAPATLAVGQVDVHLFSVCLADSGAPKDWSASATCPGIYRIDGGKASARGLSDHVSSVKRHGDIVVVSLHWGSNWGYKVASDHRRLAHTLIEAGADVVHGHSSHHPKGIEIYGQRPILYGCGDFINDYEGIGGHEGFRPDLVAVYLVDLAPDGALIGLTLLPFRLRRFRLHKVSEDDARWLADRLSQKGNAGVSLHTTREKGPGLQLQVDW